MKRLLLYWMFVLALGPDLLAQLLSAANVHPGTSSLPSSGSIDRLPNYMAVAGVIVVIGQGFGAAAASVRRRN